jgi:hypothetical protein
MLGAKIDQELSNGSALVTGGIGTECSTERIDRTIKRWSQGMLEGRTTRAIHKETFGGDECVAPLRAHTQDRHLGA